MKINEIRNVRSEREDMETATPEILRIIRDYYEQLCTNKLDSLEEIDTFLEIYNLKNLKIWQITSKDIESIKNFPKRQKSRSTELHLRILLNNQRCNIPCSIPKVEEKATLPNSLYEASIALIPKSNKDSIKKIKS